MPHCWKSPSSQAQGTNSTSFLTHLRKPRVLTPLRSLRKERSGVSTLGLRRWEITCHGSFYIYFSCWWCRCYYLGITSLLAHLVWKFIADLVVFQFSKLRAEISRDAIRYTGMAVQSDHRYIFFLHLFILID